jgi:hypothetical protein
MHHLIWNFQFRVHSVLQNLNHSGLKINTINIHLRVRDEKPSNFDFYFVQFHWETRILAWILESEDQTRRTSFARVLELFQIQIFQCYFNTCFGPLTPACVCPSGSLLALKAFWHVCYPMVMGSTPIKTILFSNFSIFSCFLQNFHIFFNQSKLLILRWYFVHLSINTSILW